MSGHVPPSSLNLVLGREGTNLPYSGTYFPDPRCPGFRNPGPCFPIPHGPATLYPDP